MMSKLTKIKELKRLVKNDLMLSVWFWETPRPDEEPTDTDIFYSNSFGAKRCKPLGVLKKTKAIIWHEVKSYSNKQ